MAECVSCGEDFEPEYENDDECPKCDHHQYLLESKLKGVEL